MILGLIPARAGSTGIENKNLINGPIFRGAPLLLHTVEAALASQHIDKTVVSTNDDATIEYFTNSMYKVDTHRRNEYLSSSTSPTEETIREVMRLYQPDICVLLQLTSPLRTGKHIDEAIDLLRNTGSDAVVSVSPFHGFLWREAGQYSLTTYDAQHRPMRQAQQQWKENGAIYAFTKDCWEGYGARWGGRVGLYKMDALYGVEIDEPLDLAYADAACAFMERNVS